MEFSRILRKIQKVRNEHVTYLYSHLKSIELGSPCTDEKYFLFSLSKVGYFWIAEYMRKLAKKESCVCVLGIPFFWHNIFLFIFPLDVGLVFQHTRRIWWDISHLSEQ